MRWGALPKAGFRKHGVMIKVDRGGSAASCARKIRLSMAHDHSKKNTGAKATEPVASRPPSPPSKTPDSKTSNSKKGRKVAAANAPDTATYCIGDECACQNRIADRRTPAAVVSHTRQ
jgi:hypothetical protein